MNNSLTKILIRTISAPILICYFISSLTAPAYSLIPRLVTDTGISAEQARRVSSKPAVVIDAIREKLSYAETFEEFYEILNNYSKIMVGQETITPQQLIDKIISYKETNSEEARSYLAKIDANMPMWISELEGQAGESPEQAVDNKKSTALEESAEEIISGLQKPTQDFFDGNASAREISASILKAIAGRSSMSALNVTTTLENGRIRFNITPTYDIIERQTDPDAAGQYTKLLKTISLSLELLFNDSNFHESISKEIKEAGNLITARGEEKNYHGFHAEQVEAVIGAIKTSFSDEVSNFFKDGDFAKLRQYVDSDLIRDILLTLGGKQAGREGMAEYLQGYLNDIFQLERPKDLNELAQAVNKLELTYKFAAAISMREKDIKPIGELSPKESEFKVVNADSYQEFMEKASKRGNMPGLLLFDRVFNVNNRLYALAYRNGRFEVYYTSETYSTVAGQYQWSRQEATIGAIRNGVLETGWHAKPLGENPHDLTDAASAEINKLLGSGLNVVKQPDAALLNDIQLDLGLVYDSDGIRMERGANGNPQYVTNGGTRVDFDRYFGKDNWDNAAKRDRLITSNQEREVLASMQEIEGLLTRAAGAQPVAHAVDALNREFALSAI